MAIKFTTPLGTDVFTIATPSNSVGVSQSTTSMCFTFQVDGDLGNSAYMHICGQQVNFGFMCEVIRSERGELLQPASDRSHGLSDLD